MQSVQQALCRVHQAGEIFLADGPAEVFDLSFMASRDTEFPNFELTDQVALVTGAARGLGRAISLALAHAGAHVALGLRDVSTADSLQRDIEAMGRRALRLQMDMSRPEQIAAAIDKAIYHFGRLDILVNNAGVGPENPAENVREEDFDLTVSVNLKGTFFASQAAGKVMIRQKHGCIWLLRLVDDDLIAMVRVLGFYHPMRGETVLLKTR